MLERRSQCSRRRWPGRRDGDLMSLCSSTPSAAAMVSVNTQYQVEHRAMARAGKSGLVAHGNHMEHTGIIWKVCLSLTGSLYTVPGRAKRQFRAVGGSRPTSACPGRTVGGGLGNWAVAVQACQSGEQRDARQPPHQRASCGGGGDGGGGGRSKDEVAVRWSRRSVPCPCPKPCWG